MRVFGEKILEKLNVKIARIYGRGWIPLYI